MIPEKPKVQAAFCKCGKARMIATTKTEFDRAACRDFAKLLEWGLSVRAITLEEARKVEGFCFGECGLLTHPAAVKIAQQHAKREAKESKHPAGFVPGGFGSLATPPKP